MRLVLLMSFFWSHIYPKKLYGLRTMIMKWLITM
uniref:Uncharacterized protein n=1 Tax=Rhizophora mucronata TaxID=61149 RepID=A0A2P2QH45_RHIMU